MEKSTYWILPLSAKEITFDTPRGKTVVASVSGAEFSLIKEKGAIIDKSDVVVNTPFGDLIYRPRFSKTDGSQLTKSFNVTKSFCKKLYPKVTRKLWGESLPELFDFEELEHRMKFIQKVIESNIVLGVVGASGKKGFLKRVTPIAPLKELDRFENILMESEIDVYENNITTLYGTLERLIEQMSAMGESKRKQQIIDKFETLM